MRRPKGSKIFWAVLASKIPRRVSREVPQALGEAGHLSLLSKRNQIALEKVLTNISISPPHRSNLQQLELRLSIWANRFVISH